MILKYGFTFELIVLRTWVYLVIFSDKLFLFSSASSVFSGLFYVDFIVRLPWRSSFHMLFSFFLF